MCRASALPSLNVVATALLAPALLPQGLLRCFQRSASNRLEAVPGCEGTGVRGSDYCYDQNKYPGYLLNVDSDDVDGPLNACEGDCNDNGGEYPKVSFSRDCLFGVAHAKPPPLSPDCMATLVCFQRGSSASDDASADAPVPGCEGKGRNGEDYCVHAHLFN